MEKKKNNDIRRKIKMNYIISFPRSGQHLIESVLRYIYDNLNKEFIYCEYYSCCSSLDNCKFNSNFQKNHDFWLNDKLDYNTNKLLINNNNKYLVLYRNNKIKQLEAYYTYYIKSSRIKKVYDYNELISFINGNSTYYDNFINKWVNNNQTNILKIDYYDFISNPNFNIKKIYYHFNNDKLKDESILNIKDIKFSSDNGLRKKDEAKVISLLNEIDIELYNKIKIELKW